MSSNQYPGRFLELCIKTMKEGPQEVTINSLLQGLDLTEKALASITLIEKGFIEYGLQIIPPFQEGSLDEVRILKVMQATTLFDPDELKKIIEEGENFSNEFKSTLLLDVKRQKHHPSAKIAELRSDDVLHTALKSIAGFLNWSGGTLLIGVEDNGNCLGIEKDFCFFKESQQSVDGWELELRNQVNGKFYDGNAVNQHISVSYSTVGEATVAIIKVYPRKKLSFLKKGANDYVLYTRQGNSSRQIQITEFEEYLETRRRATNT